MHAYLCACVPGWVCTGAPVHGVGAEVNVECIPQWLLHFIFETGASTDPGAHQLARLDLSASPRDAPVSATPVLKLWVHGFYINGRKRNLNSGPHSSGQALYWVGHLPVSGYAILVMLHGWGINVVFKLSHTWKSVTAASVCKHDLTEHPTHTLRQGMCTSG